MANKQFLSQLWNSKRYLIVFLSFLGFINVYTLRINLSVAIVAMTDANGTQEVTFDWSNAEKGLILSSFFYGYILTQFIGGYIATLIGGNIIFGLGIGVTALSTLFIPMVANSWGVGGLIGVRVIQGIASGLAFCSCHPLFAKWCPKNEKSTMVSLATSGNHFGAVIANVLSGTIAVNYGWPTVFYGFGVTGSIWTLVWLLIVRKSPENDSLISREERIHIRNNCEDKNTELIVPWRKLLTSPAVWAITSAHTAFNWGFYTFLTQLPSYLKDTLKYDLESTGFIAALPYLLLGILMCFCGMAADWIKLKGYLPMKNIRKFFICVPHILDAILLIIVAFTPNPAVCVGLITTAVALGGFSSSSFLTNPLDIAPKYAGIVLGISNTIATIPGIISPYLTGLIVSNHTVEEWRIVFFIAAGIYFLGSILYAILGQGEIQKWAVDPQPLEEKPVDYDTNYGDKRKFKD